MSENFTPGPWKPVNLIRLADYADCDPPKVVAGDGGSQRVVAHVAKCDRSHQTNANTYLLAAAPELYEALDRLYDRISDNCDRAFLEEAAEDLAFARMASAKARGEG